PGTWTLRVTSEGFAPWERKGIEAGPGTVLEPIAVLLDRGTTVRGVVRGLPEGCPFELEFRREGECPRAPVGKDCSYRATGLRPGTYQVLLSGGPFLPSTDPAQLVVGEGEREVNFDVEALLAGTLEVRLRSARGSIGEDLRLEIRDKAGRVVRTVNGRTSGLLYFTLLPGEFLVRAGVSGADAREERVSVQAGASSKVEIDLP
ncbi:MAG: hypothetical protein ACREIU_04815, partial [Planctomycetota bacterium]